MHKIGESADFVKVMGQRLLAIDMFPKLAWRTTLLGDWAIRPRVMNGAPRAAALRALRNERREKERFVMIRKIQSQFAGVCARSEISPPGSGSCIFILRIEP